MIWNRVISARLLCAARLVANAASHFDFDIDAVKGFLDPLEGAALYAAAEEMAGKGLCVEIGSYCGKSTIILGTACQKAGGTLLAIDHHRGSEENQPGEEYFDPDLDDGEGGMSSLLQFRANMRAAGLEDTVVTGAQPLTNCRASAAWPHRLWCLSMAAIPCLPRWPIGKIGGRG